MQVPLAKYYNTGQSSSQIKRVNIPVSPKESLFARYKYVQGIPARGATQAVPLSRLKTLNSLMAKMNKPQTMPQRRDMNPHQVDNLIDQYTREAHIKINSPKSQYHAGLSPNPVGMVFSTVA